MNNQEIQIIVGILLLLVYVYCTRNNEGYRRRGRGSCQTKPLNGRKIYGRVKPFKRCRKGVRRGFISKLKRVITPIPRGRVPVNPGRKIISRQLQGGRDLQASMGKTIYEGAKKGANYVEIMTNRQGNNTSTMVTFYKGASRATKSTAESRAMKNNMKAAFILPPGRARAVRRGRRGRRGGLSRFIQRCRNMFRRRKIPVGDTPRMAARRASLTPQQWAREDKLA